jgi:hypothetical protein
VRKVLPCTMVDPIGLELALRDDEDDPARR